jgi:hypothetical protein
VLGITSLGLASLGIALRKILNKKTSIS